MMFKKLAIGLAIVLIASCKHEHKPQSSTNESFRKDEFVVVATVNSGDSYTQSKVVRVLRSKGIDCYFEGSVVYGLFVLDSDSLKTVETLKSTADLADCRFEIESRYD